MGNSGLEVAPLALGGNVFGWTADESTSFMILDAFVAAGCNLIDTADIYSKWSPPNPSGRMGRQVLFCNSREEISDSLHDDSHRVLRYVHVWTEMAPIPGENMRCLATLCRGEYRPVFLGN